MAAAVLCNVSTFKKPAQHVSLLDSCKLAISLRDLSMNKANARAPSIDVHSQTLYGVCLYIPEGNSQNEADTNLDGTSTLCGNNHRSIIFHVHFKRRSVDRALARAHN